MSDAELRRLERGWNAGRADAGARLVVERLRRGLHLTGPDREAWAAMWAEMTPDTDIAFRDALLVAGRRDITSLGVWTWLARLDDGRWLHVVAWHECPCGWDCWAHRRVHVTSLDELAALLTEEEVRGLLTALPPAERLQACRETQAASPCDRRLRELERGWAGGDLAAGARLVVGRLRRGLPVAAPDAPAWRAMWEDADVGEADPAWSAATLVAGCRSVAARRWCWLARLQDGRWLHANGEQWCPVCNAGWFCFSEGRFEPTTLDELTTRLTEDEVRGLLATS